MTRAEKRALEAYPPKFSSGKLHAKRVQAETVDTHRPIRTIYIKGYEQAEKDLGWQPVDKALPPLDEEVIVLTDDLNIGGPYKIAFGHIVDKDVAIDYDGWNVPGVKYWMPMPEIKIVEKK